jgi:alkylation response protein AidB-like acyl-CoA dehydrogenase
MDFGVPEETRRLLDDLDEFVEREIEPLEAEHPEFFDHRREAARTNWDDGTPTAEWLALVEEMRERAAEAGFHRLLLPEELGGQGASHLTMAIVREHLASRGPGLHNVLSFEVSVVGNHSAARLIHRYGSEEQRERYLEGMLSGEVVGAFGLTEPEHGSDATHMDTVARKEGDEWVIDGRKRWITGMDRADVVQVFARTSGEDGDHEGITGFLVPTDTGGLEVPYYHWTFNMPTDHAELVLDGVRVPEGAVVGEEGAGLRQAQDFVHEGRIRQAASSLGAAQFCIDETARYARERETWGTELARRQAIQFPTADLHTEAEMLRGLVRKTAWMLDREDQLAVSEKVSMANYRANRLACDAADWAMQVHGGMGYSRAKPFEHVYRHHRRYRITEGTEQIQLRNVAGHLFDYVG